MRAEAKELEFERAAALRDEIQEIRLRVLDQDQSAIIARAAELAATFAQAPTRGVGMTKRLFDNAQTATLDEQLELEAQLQSAATQTDDFREGVTAFLEKRPPQFTGR